MSDVEEFYKAKKAISKINEMILKHQEAIKLLEKLKRQQLDRGNNAALRLGWISEPRQY